MHNSLLPERRPKDIPVVREKSAGVKTHKGWGTDVTGTGS